MSDNDFIITMLKEWGLEKYTSIFLGMCVFLLIAKLFSRGRKIKKYCIFYIQLKLANNTLNVVRIKCGIQN